MPTNVSALVKAHGWAGLATITEPIKYIFTGIDPGEAHKWTSSITAFPMMMTILTNKSYSVVPWGYVFLELDLTLAKEYQGSIVALQAEETAPFALYRCSGGYAAHLSCPGRWVDIVQDFAGKRGRADSFSGDDSAIEIL
jgi:hypothetical protein